MSKSKRKLKRPSQPQSQSEMAASPDSGQSEPNGSQAPGASSAAVSAASGTAPAVPVKRAAPANLQKKSSGGFFKKVEENRAPVDVDRPHRFKRPLWKHLVRYPAAFTLVMLNVANFMSLVTRLMNHGRIDPLLELIFILLILFIDLFMFVPILLEVNKIETDQDGLKVGALVWRVKLQWDEIVSFSQPKYLKFAILRTRKGMIYFLNKYDLKPFFELAEIISAKMKPTIQDREG